MDQDRLLDRLHKYIVEGASNMSESQDLVHAVERRIHNYRDATSKILVKMWNQSDPTGQLEIADRLIQLWPESERGYLLKASTLDMIGRKNEAQQVARHGIKCVEMSIRTGTEDQAHGERSITHLARYLCPEDEQQPEKTTPRRSPTDLLSLPDEVIGMIFDYLDNRDLGRTILVSAEWRSVLLEQSTYLRIPNLKTYVTEAEMGEFLSLCKEAGITWIRKLHVTPFQGDECGILARLFESGIGVDDFSITAESDNALGRMLQESADARQFLSVPTKLGIVLVMAHHTNRLNYIMAQFPQVSSFSLEIRGMRESILQLDPDDTVTSFPNLTSLFIDIDGQRHDLKNHILAQIFRRNKFTSVVDFGMTWYLWEVQIISSIITKKLKSLRFMLSEYAPAEALLESLDRSGAKLDELEVDGFSCETLQGIGLSPLSNLRTLRITQVEMRWQDISKLINATRGNLVELAFSYDSEVRQDQDIREAALLANAVTVCPKLKRLALCSEDIRLLKPTLIRIGQSLEELRFLHHDYPVYDEPLDDLLRDRRELPLLRRIHGVRDTSVSQEMITKMEQEWHLEVD